LRSFRWATISRRWPEVSLVRQTVGTIHVIRSVIYLAVVSYGTNTTLRIFFPSWRRVVPLKVSVRETKGLDGSKFAPLRHPVRNFLTVCGNIENTALVRERWLFGSGIRATICAALPTRNDSRRSLHARYWRHFSVADGESRLLGVKWPNSQPRIIARDAFRIVKGVEAVNSFCFAGVALQIGHEFFDHPLPFLFAGIR
jgi:hypothetical protein